MNPLTWQNPEQLFVAQVLKKIFYNSVAELRLTEQRPYVYFSADNLIAATDTTHLYIYSPHDRQEFKYKKQGNALQLVTGEDSTFYVMKKYCFSTLQSAEYLVKEHKTVNKATGQ